MCCAVLSHFSRVQLFATLWTSACQATLSMGFPRQEYWSGLPCPPPGDLPDSGIEPASLLSPALASRYFTTSTTWGTLNLPYDQQSQYWSYHNSREQVLVKSGKSTKIC